MVQGGAGAGEPPGRPRSRAPHRGEGAVTAVGAQPEEAGGDRAGGVDDRAVTGRCSRQAPRVAPATNATLPSSIDILRFD